MPIVQGAATFQRTVTDDGRLVLDATP